MRFDSRNSDQLRKIKITPGFTRYAEGSVLIESGHTQILCTASVDASIPKWLSGSGKGWITAEYGMLPRSTHTRMQREKAASSGRTQEISRLISRSLRAGVDLQILGERQMIVDCDVLQADGGTRTASITGGFVAMALAFQKLMAVGLLQKNPLKDYIAAVSVGLQKSDVMLDLCYEEDSQVSTDMNFVMTGRGKFVEIQGTAEGDAFSDTDMNRMVQLAMKGCDELFQAQTDVIGSFFARPTSL